MWQSMKKTRFNVYAPQGIQEHTAKQVRRSHFVIKFKEEKLIKIGFVFKLQRGKKFNEKNYFRGLLTEENQLEMQSLHVFIIGSR